ncbi:hypothetical protein Pcinc_008089 [Petrolisthes cinctipes]|uniref:Uncharacterized protein n=1 Tax=Petrolisthes cinctipes TaxID=88211 RepID=A0AAE1G9P0_PETCI|nr:hypothetical protein Pcinc_008089 [Petrolisthes cinctipes]
MVGIASEDGMKVKEAAKWLEGDESTVISGAKLPLRTPYLNNFFGSILRVASRRATDPRPVFNSISRCYFNPTGVTECTGYVGQLLMLVIRSLNLTIVSSKFVGCGLANQEGTRVMAVQERKADIALGTCSITSNRLQAVDFTEFFKVIRSSILTGEPAAIDSAFILFYVLSGSTWICLVVYLVMVTIVLWVMGRILAAVYPGLYLPLNDSIAVTTKSFIYQNPPSAEVQEPPSAVRCKEGHPGGEEGRPEDEEDRPEGEESRSLSEEGRSLSEEGRPRGEEDPPGGD